MVHIASMTMLYMQMDQMNFASEMQASQIFKYAISTEMIFVVVNVSEKFKDKSLKNNESS